MSPIPLNTTFTLTQKSLNFRNKQLSKTGVIENAEHLRLRIA